MAQQGRRAEDSRLLLSDLHSKQWLSSLFLCPSRSRRVGKVHIFSRCPAHPRPLARALSRRTEPIMSDPPRTAPAHPYPSSSFSASTSRRADSQQLPPTQSWHPQSPSAFSHDQQPDPFSSEAAWAAANVISTSRPLRASHLDVPSLDRVPFAGVFSALSLPSYSLAHPHKTHPILPCLASLPQCASSVRSIAPIPRPSVHSRPRASQNLRHPPPVRTLSTPALLATQ